MLVGLGSGCTLILDFSELADASVEDAGVDPCEAFEDVNDGRDTAPEIPAAGLSAAICFQEPPDVDFYRFTADGNETITLRLSMSDGTGPGNLDIRVFAAGETTELFESGTETNEDVIEAGQLGAGDYLVEVYGVSPDSTNEYQLVLERS